MNSALTLQSLAIKAARENNWDEAVRLNQNIVDQAGDDTSALNRLGFCYLQMNAIKKAKVAYERVMELDKYNPIAKKYLEVIGMMKSKSDKPISLPNGMFQENFIDEPGKTKTIQLCRVADPSALSRTAIGTPCELQIKTHNIAVETTDGLYLGSLPDDLSHHLSRLISGGNQYKTVVKSITKNCVSVFIKELSRCKKFAYTTSFPNGVHQNHNESHLELLIDQPSMDMGETGEDSVEETVEESRERERDEE